MRLTFRQGIARYQTDIYATPTFLQRSGDFVDLIVSPDPTIVVFAHKNATYVIEETKTVQKAWGPFTGQGTRYLYWDINMLDASVTRGYTLFPQVVSAKAPNNPSNDQHWFDSENHQMKVWNGSKWIDKVRVFAATFSSQAIINPFPLGTQAGEKGVFEGGNLVLDSYSKPLRQSDGTFVTSATELSIINASTKKVKFEAEIVSGMASENVPKFSFVQGQRGKQFRLARSDDWRTRIIGLATEDLYTSEIGNIETNGLVRNEQWDWPAESVGRPVFCGPTGEVSLTPPTTGVLQVVGYVYDQDSIFLNIQNVTILSDLTPSAPVAPTGDAPTATFTSTPSEGTAPLTVQFKSTALHGPRTWEWDFMNNGTVNSTQENPSFTFKDAGRYTVRFKVGNEFGENQVVKTSAVVVLPPSEKGSNTNLNIQLGGALQVSRNEDFPVTIMAANSGLQAATRVLRTVIFDDVNGEPVNILSRPQGSLLVRAGDTMILTLPLINNFNPGQSATATFTVKAPNRNGVISMRAGIVSPEVDSSLGDNISVLSVRIK